MEPSLEDLARERHERCNPGFPWRLIGLIALCLAIGGLGSAATMPEIKGWYAGLVKPPFNPPNWIFGPVWSTLYVLMACSANAAWTDRQARRTFFIILLVNSLWSLLFFGMHRPDLALIDILGYLMIVAAQSPWLIAAGLILSQVGRGAHSTAQVALWADVLKDRRMAIGAAAISSVANIGVWLLPIGFGMAKDATGGYVAGLWALPVMHVLALGGAVALWRSGKRT